MRREHAALHRLPRSLRERLFHSRRRCRHTLLAPEAPDSRWKCCPLWHRKLTNKWNSRAFAVRHGCRVPELYWHGADLDALPFSTLPGAYVVRPMWGTAHCQGTFAMWNGLNLMNGRRYSADEVRDELRETTAPPGRRRRKTVPVLVEQFIADRDGDCALPTEYKCYTFGASVAAIAVNRRVSRSEARRAAFLPDWTPIPGGIRSEPEALTEEVPRPECLDEMLACARRLGSEIGRHARIDFYAPSSGPVFGELTFWSHSAQGYNAFAEKLFAAHWERAFPTG